jgi:hypothetical protein
MMLPQKDPQARVELQYLRSEGEKERQNWERGISLPSHSH